MASFGKTKPGAPIDKAGLKWDRLTVSMCLNSQNLTLLPDLVKFTRLRILYCSGNNFSSLDNLVLPSSLVELKIKYCQLGSLTRIALPNGLQFLDISFNSLTQLPPLPPTLLHLNCGNNLLETLPILPPTLHVLLCEFNKLVILPTLPTSLINLNLMNNQVETLPRLPTSLQVMLCRFNKLLVLPTLPSSLRNLDCGKNCLQVLPVLPINLRRLSCDFNNLTMLPALPVHLHGLEYWGNPIEEVLGENIHVGVDVIRWKIQVLINFSHLYYSLKFKAKFRTWLWERVKRPKIEAYYHPANLAAQLIDPNVDLVNVLESW